MELPELAKLVDDYVEQRSRRLAADKVAKDLKSTENTLKEKLINLCIVNETFMVAGTTHKVTRRPKDKPITNNWEDLYKYIVENNAVDLLQRRLNQGAIEARKEDGIEIPSIEYIEVNDLSVSKL